MDSVKTFVHSYTGIDNYVYSDLYFLHRSYIKRFIFALIISTEVDALVFYNKLTALSGVLIEKLIQTTDHELIPARNASLAEMQGSAIGSNVRYYPT
jgi:hypothetical protein